MFKKNVSGQDVYFTMISSISGNCVYSGSNISLSGKISGYVGIDGAAQAAIAGYVTEDSFGQYHLNGFAADFNGNNLGFFFCTSSGIISVSLCAVTVGGISGALWVGSGQTVLVYSGQLSGQQINVLTNLDKSGYTVGTLSGTTFIASGPFVVGTVNVTSGQVYLSSGQTVNLLSGNITQLYSGQTVLVYSGQLSGFQVNTQINLDKSGYTAGTLSGTTFIASGPFVVGTVNVTSGLVFLSSGQLVNLLSGNIVQLYSGQTTLPYSGQLSGQYVTTQINLDKSGYTANSLSGTEFIASGTQVNLLSGNIVQLYSGQTVLIYSGQLSGQQVNTQINLDKSGYTANSISGTTQLASGQAVNLLSGNITQIYSGNLVNVFSGTLYPTSGSTQIASGPFIVGTVSITSGTTFLSSGQLVGLLSGQRALPYSGQLSGQFVTTQVNNDKSGYTLLPTGLDLISTAVSGVATTFSQMSVQVWRRFFKNTTLTTTQLKTYQDDNSTIMTTQVVSDNGTTQTQGPAT